MAADATEEADDPGPTVEVVEFLVAGERFAVAVDDVDSIEDHGGTTRVPRTGDAIVGVMDLRGEITAVIDPRVHLDVETDGSTEGGQVLVLDDAKDKQKLGFLVEEVVGVEDYPETAVASAAEVPDLETTGVTQQVIQSIIRRPSPDADFEPVSWLDVDEIVRRSRQYR